MQRLRPLSLALIALIALAWGLPALAVYPGSCANGKTVYNKTNPGSGAIKSCSDSNCHGPGVDKKNIQNGSGNPGAINNALDGTSANAEMVAFNLRANLPLSSQDIDDLATWIFYAPACPLSAPILNAAPSPVTFGSTAIGATSPAVTVTVTNTGTADATGVGLTNSNATEFPVSGSTCTGTLAAGNGTCSFNVAFNPSQSDSRTGSIAINRNGGAGAIVNVSGTGTTGSSAPPIVTVVEYHNSDFDHYFITPVAAEIALLDAHAAPFQAWSRTGFSFNAYVNATAPGGSVAICRFFNSSFAPKSSHFYAPHGLGCEATIASFPDWKLEDDKLFNSMLPDANGACPGGTIPVYRLYNSGMGGAPNHRFVTSLAERQTMINQGFVAEGYGIGVGMCVPP
jgi:Repeat of unknown function (DUF5648)